MSQYLSSDFFLDTVQAMVFSDRSFTKTGLKRSVDLFMQGLAKAYAEVQTQALNP